VSKVKMGLRDYRWVSNALPGRVAPMDLDCVLERGGSFLCMEFKPGGAPLPLGQRLTLKALVRQGWDVWVAWEQDDGSVHVGAMDRRGEVPFVEELTQDELTERVTDWWEAENAR
jgi:hypothetical protein